MDSVYNWINVGLDSSLHFQALNSAKAASFLHASLSPSTKGNISQGVVLKD